MKILGIESSCDETAAAIVEETGEPMRPWRVRSNVIASQVAIHREWGGVVPELASRQHLRDICGVAERALEDAAVDWRDVDAIAATQGPGLVGSLLVGFSFAKAAAATLDVPFVPVHHLAGHIESLVLEHGELPYPASILVVSGGHTSLYLVPVAGTYELVGRTRDDAAGEAYDKVAKLLGLGYPGGPIIDELAKQGNELAIEFPVARLTHRDRNPAPPVRLPKGFEKALQYRTDFSFSGLKTAVLRYVKKRAAAQGAEPGVDGSPRTLFSDRDIADICASFQRAVIEALLDRTFDAARWHNARSVGIAGGVSANSRLRTVAAARGEKAGLPVFVPSLKLATDNAAMIAAAGLRRFHQGVAAPLSLNAHANLVLGP
ncbi:MAG: tRNA (adenosine(37)-N6)-threonylcarbamoyltransferase complex transferase subunit TsaD [Luteitalea sp.]|nr:tRNA (adenosine(37)-N6)-threonylcarbamoyltransferase complex transferase subunit TsaD [Luteitalea sp.]